MKTNDEDQLGAKVEKERIVAVGLLTQHDLNLLGQSFTRAWPVEDNSCFDGLLKAIDEAEQELARSGKDTVIGGNP